MTKSNDCTEYQKRLEEERNKTIELADNYFDRKSSALMAGLAVKALHLIDGITLPFLLILLGSPSSFKTTILDIIAGLVDSYNSRHFTAKAFVTNFAKARKEELDKMDLLPRIENKTFITPELAPIFTGKDNKLDETFGVLTSILDGKGYVTDAGTHGRRGYDRPLFFTWLGAAVEVPRKVWKRLATLGPKIYFLRLPVQQTDQQVLDKLLFNAKEKPYKERLAEAIEQTKKFWDLVSNSPYKKGEKIVWDCEKDDVETVSKIALLAQILSCLRADVTNGIAIKENPQRAFDSLTNIARGHALLFGRNYLAREDLKLVIQVALSSAAIERVKIFWALIENNGYVTTNDVITKSKVARNTALFSMYVLSQSKLVDAETIPAKSHPIKSIKLKDHYAWFLTDEFSELYKI